MSAEHGSRAGDVAHPGGNIQLIAESYRLETEVKDAKLAGSHSSRSRDLFRDRRQLHYDNSFENQKHLLPKTGEKEQPYLRKQEDPLRPRRHFGSAEELKEPAQSNNRTGRFTRRRRNYKRESKRRDFFSWSFGSTTNLDTVA